MPLSVEQFTQRLVSSGVMSEDELRDWIAAVPEAQRPADGETLARELVRGKRLTKYQAEQIHAGKGDSLTLGNYVVLDKLGQGGMGVVLKAEHRRMKRVVALKVMSPKAVETPDALKRFHREVEAAAKLTHPNIVNAFDADEAKETHFLVMEYVEGTDLSKFVRQHGPMPVEQAVRCIIQAARGLEFAHEQGVIHRDIKPANLLIDAKGTVKILDMGLARIVDSVGGSSEGADLTNTGTIVGTVDYVSPDQAEDTRNADARSDIYSLGCTLFYLMTGRVVYGGATVMKKLLAHRESPIPTLSGECGEQDLSEISSSPHSLRSTLNSVFRRMVAKRPEDRPQSMSEVIADLERCLAGGSPMVAFERLSGPLVNSVTSVLSADGVELELPQPKTAETIVLPLRGDSPAAQTETIGSVKMGVGTDPRNEQTIWLDQTRQPLGNETVNGKKRLLGVAAVVLFVVVTMIVVNQSNKPVLHDNTTNETASTNSKSVSPATADSGNGKSDKVPAGESPLVVMEVPPQNEFSSPEEIAEIGSQVFGPKIAANGLSLWFHAPEDRAAGSGRLILWQAWRHAAHEPFHKPIPSEESLNNQLDHNLTDVTLSADELVLCFCRTKVEVGNSDLWLSTRPSGDASWSAPVSAGAGVNSDRSEWEPELSPNGLELFFHSERPNKNGGTDLWGSRRTSRNADFGPAENLGPEINSADNEGGAALSGDGLTLMFHRLTPNENGVWRATRNSLDAPFEAPQRVTIPLQANEEFFSVSLSGSGEELYGTYRSKGRSVVGLSRLKPGAAVAAEKNFAIRVSPGVHVEMPSLKLDPAAPHTMEAWVSPASKVRDDKHVFGWPGPSSLFLRREDSSWTFGLSRTDRFQFVHDPQPLTPGRRVHVATVRTGKEYRLFVDGRRVVSQPEPATPLNGQSKPFSLSVASAKAAFHGDYDEVRVSRVARYDGNFAPQTRLQPDADTLALYHCDENGGDQLLDSSGNKHHGKIIGKATWSPIGGPHEVATPNDGISAQKNQEVWAKQLGVEVEIENSVGMKLRLIPPGEFLMGAPDSDADAQPHEKPQHRVRLTKPFYLGATEVTVGQFRRFVDATKYVTQAESDGQGAFEISPRMRSDRYVWNSKSVKPEASEADPVRCVSWEDARRFCEWISETEGKTYRLPTEAEWEYACRAGTQTRYSFGDQLTDSPTPPRGSGASLLPVAQLPANPFGLFDMHGNVNEICWDSGRDYSAAKAPVIDPVGSLLPETPAVVRGGAVSSNPISMRSSHRYLNDSREFPKTNFATKVKGFRVVRIVDAPQPTAK